MSVSDIFYVMFLVLFCFIGLLITIKAIRVKVSTLIYFGINLIVFGLASIPALLDLNYIVSIFRGIAFVILLIFVQKTFYVNKKTPFPILLIITIIVTTTSVIGDLFIYNNINITFIDYSRDISRGLLFIIPFSWMAYAAFKAYNEIKLLDIEPHVKKKYQLFWWVSILNILPALIFFFRVPFNELLNIDIYNLLYLGYFITSIPIIIMNYTLWFMPVRVKNYFNRGYTPKKIEGEDLSEEELMKGLMGGL